MFPPFLDPLSRKYKITFDGSPEAWDRIEATLKINADLRSSGIFNQFIVVARLLTAADIVTKMDSADSTDWVEWLLHYVESFEIRYRHSVAGDMLDSDSDSGKPTTTKRCRSMLT